MVVDHPAQILLVDAQPKSVGGNDRLELARHESILNLFPLSGGSFAVIESDSEVIGQHVVQPFGFLDGGDVDDTRSVEFA